MPETTDSCPDFVSLAEERRRAGDAHAALALAEEGLEKARGESVDCLRTRVALALALLDLGDLPRARTELACGLDTLAIDPDTPCAEPNASSAFGEALGEEEIEYAFEQAESNPDEMMDANKVVEQTLRRDQEAQAGVAFDVSEHPTYATNTMAELLASQGSTVQAEALRNSLLLSQSTRPPGPDAPGVGEAVSGESVGMERDVDRLRVVTTLETWLHNVRRNVERDAAHKGAAATHSRGA